MTEDQLINILALQHVPKICSTNAKKLIAHCGSAEAVFKEKKSNILLETHSPDLVKQFMQELKAGKLSPDDFLLYKVTREKGETCIHQVEIDSEKEFDVYENWERGVST